MTDTPIAEYAELRDLCVSIAREAGDMARAGRVAARHGATLRRHTKSTPTDMVTEFDGAAERLIVEAIRTARPDDAIVGEEGADQTGTSGYEWHVDPIDGTTNFVYDLPTWTCSVGVRRGGVSVAGAVYVPMLGEMYAAAAGHGATLDGEPITASPLTDASLALVAVGFAYSPDVRIAQARMLREVIGSVRDVRRLGAASYDLCLVAAGRVDAYYEVGLNSWDVAAGEVICREAGAVTSDWSGGPLRPAQLLAAAPGVHADLVRLLTSAAEAMP